MEFNLWDCDIRVWYVIRFLGTNEFSSTGSWIGKMIHMASFGFAQRYWAWIRNYTHHGQCATFPIDRGPDLGKNCVGLCKLSNLVVQRSMVISCVILYDSITGLYCQSTVNHLNPRPYSGLWLLQTLFCTLHCVSVASPQSYNFNSSCCWR